MQFNADPGFDGPEGRMAHLGIMVEDLEEALAEAMKWGVRELPAGATGWPCRMGWNSNRCRRASSNRAPENGLNGL